MHRPHVVRAALAIVTVALVVPRPALAETGRVLSTLDSVPPPQGADHHSQVTGLLSGRLVRDGVVSGCGASRAFPGVVLATDSFRYDAYTFTSFETKCLTVHLLKNTGTGYLQVAGYSTLNPANLAENWLADSGNSANGSQPEAIAFSMNVTAGETYTLVVFSVTTGEPNVPYELTWDAPFTVSHADALARSQPLSDHRYFAHTGGWAPGPRMFPNGVSSACGVPRGYPGTTGAGPYRYHAYSFMPAVSGCATFRVRLTTVAGNLQAAVYETAFDPNDMTYRWLADAGASTGTNPPSELVFSTEVYAGQPFTLVIFDIIPNQQVAAYDFSVDLPIQPPTRFRTVSVVGNTVTFRWTPPVNGPAPDTYVIEGGVNPGDVLASVPLGRNIPLATLVVPTGSFYARVRAASGGQQSTDSNEIRIFVNVPGAPSQAADLIGVVEGSTVTLSWRNTFYGAPPASVLLYSFGTITNGFLLGLVDRVSFSGVPAGTYHLSIYARGQDGWPSPQSNVVTLTVPGTCPGIPQPPPGALAFKTGNTITVLWDPPATGPAPTSYELRVAGTFTGTFGTTGRMMSGAVGAGTYSLQVRSLNACGASVYAFAGYITVP